MRMKAVREPAGDHPGALLVVKAIIERAHTIDPVGSAETKRR